jgi:hypothetical protein
MESVPLAPTDVKVGDIIANISTTFVVTDVVLPSKEGHFRLWGRLIKSDGGSFRFDLLYSADGPVLVWR